MSQHTQQLGQTYGFAMFLGGSLAQFLRDHGLNDITTVVTILGFMMAFWTSLPRIVYTWQWLRGKHS